MNCVNDIKGLVATLAEFKGYRANDFRNLRRRLERELDEAIQVVIEDYQQVSVQPSHFYSFGSRKLELIISKWNFWFQKIAEFFVRLSNRNSET